MVASAPRSPATVGMPPLDRPEYREGKQRPRGNAMTHGLRASVLPHPDDEAALAGPVGEAAAAPDAPGSVRFDGWWARDRPSRRSTIAGHGDGREGPGSPLPGLGDLDEDHRLDAIRSPRSWRSGPRRSPPGRETLQGCDCWRVAVLAHAAEVRGGDWTPEQAAWPSTSWARPRRSRGSTAGRPGLEPARPTRRALRSWPPVASCSSRSTARPVRARPGCRTRLRSVGTG